MEVPLSQLSPSKVREMATNREKVHLQPLDWQFEEVGNRIVIYMWGLDKDSNPHLVRFPNYPATCQIQLPDFVDGHPFEWTDLRINDFVNRVAQRKPGHAPFDYTPIKAKALYYYQGDHLTQFVTLYFYTRSSMMECVKMFRYPFKFKHDERIWSSITVHAWETKIPLVRKMLTTQNCSFNGWLEVTGIHPRSRDDIGPDDVDDEGQYEKDIFGNVIRRDATEVYYQLSTFDSPKREWIANWRELKMSPVELTKDWTTKPLLLGYDIEAYSDNHRIFPNSLNIDHVVFMISCVVQRAFEPETRIRYAIVYGKSNDIPEERLANCHIIEVDDEIACIDEFSRIVRETDPDLVLGYNIFNFDYPYLDSRLSNYIREWQFMGRMVGKQTYVNTMNWSSGGYGFNNISDLVMHGRISVDMLPVIKRSRKMIRYNLDTVAANLLGCAKHDVTPTEMFLTFERQQESLDEYNEVVKRLPLNSEQDTELFGRIVEDKIKYANSALEKIAEELEQGLHKDKYSEDPNVQTAAEFNDPSKGAIYDRHGKVNWCSEDLWNLFVQIASDTVASTGPMPIEWDALTSPILGKYQAGIFIMSRVTYYCLIDSDLCIDLFEKENAWAGLTSMSEIAGVTIKEIFTRGQQIRTLSLIYDRACKEGIVLTERVAPDIDFTGGFVFNVKPDLYDRVAVVDFNSLYPSIIKSYNIDYTTLVKPEHFDFFTTPERINDVHVVKVPIPEDGDDYDLEDDEVDDNGERGMSRAQKVVSLRRAQNGARIDESGKNYVHLYVKPPECPECTPCKDCIFIQEGRKKHKACKGCAECTPPCEGPFEGVEDGEECDPWTHQCKGCRICKRKRKTHCPAHVDCCEKYNEAPFRRRGLLPKIVTELLARRKAVRAQIPSYPKGHHMRGVLDGRQLALKVVANSCYGFLGVRKGKLPLLEASVSITAMGRELTTFTAKYCVDEHGLYVVYGDTDSVMVRLNVTDPRLYNERGHALAAEISKCFIGILNLELEKVMKGVYICKKKYIGFVYEDDGTFKIDPASGRPFLLIRGVILARRDNARWLRKVYLELIYMILGENGREGTFLEVITYLVEQIKLLVSGQVHYDELVIVRGIGVHYKNETYFMKMFADNLARKGTPARPGERLGYIVHTPRNDAERKYIGNRMILPEEYNNTKDTANPYDIDYLYYLENQFQVALDQIIWCAFNTRMSQYDGIGYRPNKRCKFTRMDTPVKMIVRMLKNGQDIDKVVQSVRAIDEGDLRGPILCPEYELNNYEYPEIQRIVMPDSLPDRPATAPVTRFKIKLPKMKSKTPVHLFS